MESDGYGREQDAAELDCGNGVVVSCGSPAHVIEDGAVAVSRELITDVGPCEDCEASTRRRVLRMWEAGSIMPDGLHTHPSLQHTWLGNAV